MSFIRAFFLILILGAAFVTPQEKQPCSDVSGRWISKFGAVMEITQDGEAITGTHSERSDGVTYPISGFFKSRILSHFVNFPRVLEAFTGECLFAVSQEVTREYLYVIDFCNVTQSSTESIAWSREDKP